jgi:hypothetical protein
MLTECAAYSNVCCSALFKEDKACNGRGGLHFNIDSSLSQSQENKVCTLSYLMVECDLKKICN